MNRRGFLALVVATGVAASIPEARALVDGKPALPLYGIEIKRIIQPFDFDFQRGLCAQVTVNGQKYRAAGSIITSVYESLSKADKERIWRVIERKALIHARSGAAA